MNRSEKTEAVETLNASFNEAAVVVVTRNLGLTVAQSTDLRNKMREPAIRLPRTALPRSLSRTRSMTASAIC